MMRLFIAIAALIAAVAGEGTSHIIWVTDGGFSPEVSTAEAGDFLEFHFVRGMHSVVQTSYEKPCTFLPGGFSSGLMITPLESSENSRAFVVPVSSDKPIWFYNGSWQRCHEDGHVGVVNPINANSHGNLQKSAFDQGSTEDISQMTGGSFISTVE